VQSIDTQEIKHNANINQFKEGLMIPILKCALSQMSSCSYIEANQGLSPGDFKAYSKQLSPHKLLQIITPSKAIYR